MMLPAIEPKATMEEAWAERDRLYDAEGDRLLVEGDRHFAERDRLYDAEGDRLLAERARHYAEGLRLLAEAQRLYAEGDLVVILTAQALYGKEVQIDWVERTVTLRTEAADATP